MMKMSILLIVLGAMCFVISVARFARNSCDKKVSVEMTDDETRKVCIETGRESPAIEKLSRELRQVRAEIEELKRKCLRVDNANASWTKEIK